MIIEVALVTTAVSTISAVPISLWWKSRPWRSVTRTEEEFGAEILRAVDMMDTPHHDFLSELARVAEEETKPVKFTLYKRKPTTKPDDASSDAESVESRSSQKRQTNKVRKPTTRPSSTLGRIEVVEVPETYLKSLVEDTQPREQYQFKEHDHTKMAKQLADLCKMNISIRGFTEANDLVVEQFLKNHLRQIKNLRNDHALKIVAIAKVMVFTPTSYDVQVSTLMNTHALAQRRFDMEQKKYSREGGIFGWFTGHRRVEGPTRSS